jgi:SAM-dependent methyltransferase
MKASVLLDGFEEPWEHVRLLSDAKRTEQIIALLSAHAPGQVVTEVGCGTGLLSCVAARLGARKVVGVEPTPLWTEARRLVEANDLQDVVQIVPGRVQDCDVQPSDLVFSELLNADPFLEEVVEAMRAAASWVKPGGVLAPSRLRVFAALIRDGSSAAEVRQARASVQGLGEAYDLNLTPLQDCIGQAGVYSYISSNVVLAGPPVCVWDIALGTDQEPESLVSLELSVEEPGPVGGAVVWFEADYLAGGVMHNRPESQNHWGNLVCAWPQEIGVRMGGSVAVDVVLDEHHVEVRPR